MGLSDNLISYWKLDEASGNAIDAHGSNTLTETSGTIDATTGKVNGARDFEAGDTEYFTISDTSSLSTGDIDFTIQAWFNAESLSGEPCLLSKDSSGQREYNLYFSSSTPRLQVSADGSNTTNVVWSSSLSTGTWYLLHAWHDSVNNQIGIAINAGTPVTASHTTGVRDGSASFVLGANLLFSLYWDGLIDEVAFWKRVLTSGERTELYNSGSGRDYAYITAPAGSILPHLSGQLSGGMQNLGL